MPSILEVARFDNVIDASRTLDVLSEAGIEADLLDQHAGGALPHIGVIGVRVVVRAEDADRARAALRAAASAARPQAETAATEETPQVGQGAEPAPLSESAAEAWAWRTRALAVLGLILIIPAVGAVYRVLWVPAGVESAPRARRMLRHARILLGGVLLLLTLVWILSLGRP
jgi:hypothetical protein